MEGLISPREYARMELRRGRRHAYESLDPVETALVVIDMVPFFADADPQFGPAARGIQQLASELRQRGGTVAWVVPSADAPTRHAIEFYGPEIATMYAASGGPKPLRDRLWPGFDVHSGDLVVEKTSASAFFPGRCELHDRLGERGIDTVLVTGTVTAVCCESSARDASTLGYRVVMVADLTVGGEPASRRATFTVVYRTFGDVRTSAEVTALLATSPS